MEQFKRKTIIELRRSFYLLLDLLGIILKTSNVIVSSLVGQLPMQIIYGVENLDASSSIFNNYKANKPYKDVISVQFVRQRSPTIHSLTRVVCQTVRYEEEDDKEWKIGSERQSL
ncbi:transmembrane protein, putative [Medicago truncatula]|uniref:Transmembrane protein, putative n=1 Tax=Medicago truncatula TaxID=3880 RepID=A0A072TQS4_MEDTR|nr:transmembrane protein, putative [Medicago truncatula]